MSSSRMPLASEMEAAKAGRSHQAHIYPHTRRVMRVRTENMFALALRDYQRQRYVPTKRTRPALPKRRYSIDVNTCEAAQAPTVALPSPRKRKYEELELVEPSTSVLPFPISLRYHDFNKWSIWRPPANDDVYLGLDTAKISNMQWYWITHTDGMEKWMRDDGLDMALRVLSCDQNCEASGIGIASSVDSQVCRFPDPAGKEDYATRFGDKRWIFMPVNDAMSGVVNEGISGHHWSVVALDRVHKSMHYFDSLFVDCKEYQRDAYEVTAGMLRILGEDIEEWALNAENYSPHQYRDNLCDSDGGACGPFLYSMIGVAVDHIQKYQRAEREDECRLDLHRGFPEDFGSWWNSYRVRQQMQGSIANAKMHADAEEHTRLHDQAAVAGEDVELLDEPPLRFNIPRKLPQPARDTDTDTESDTSLTTEHSDDTIPAVETQLPSPNDMPSLEGPTAPNEETRSSSRRPDDEDTTDHLQEPEEGDVQFLFPMDEDFVDVIAEEA